MIKKFLLLTLIILFSSNTFSETDMNTTNDYTCDSNYENLDKFTKGKIIIKNNYSIKYSPEEIRKIDKCNNDEPLLIQYYCKEKTGSSLDEVLGINYTNCNYGCYNGECNKPPENTCYEKEGGIISNYDPILNFCEGDILTKYDCRETLDGTKPYHNLINCSLEYSGNGECYTNEDGVGSCKEKEPPTNSSICIEILNPVNSSEIIGITFVENNYSNSCNGNILTKYSCLDNYNTYNITNDCSIDDRVCEERKIDGFNIGYCLSNNDTTLDIDKDKNCKDGDINEKDKFIQGIITTESGRQYYDLCTPDKTKLREYYCDSDMNLKSETIPCEKGCYLGKCNEEITKDQNESIINYCIDSDRGIRPLYYGIVTTNVNSYKDHCIENSLIENYCNLENEFKSRKIDCSFECFEGKCLLPPKEEIIIDDEGNEYLNDSVTVKLSYNEEEEILTYTNYIREEFKISTQNLSAKIIKEIVNGIENEIEINPEKLALITHKIRKFKNKKEAQYFIEDIDETLKKVEIKKEITHNKAENKTRIKLEVNKKLEENINGYNVYLVIPKEIALSIEDVKILNNGGGTPFIIDKDPVIGWYFNDSSKDSSEIEYEIDGNDTSDIHFIITEQAVLYNGPNVIINYRETPCNENEITLFELDNIVDSKVYNPNTGKFYKVCMAYKDDTIFLENTASKTTLFSFDENGKVSFSDESGNKLDISHSDKLDFDLIISNERPSNEYSCLGSVLNEENSLFGDCLYADKKIWVNLNEVEKITLLNTNEDNQEEKPKQITSSETVNDINFDSNNDTSKIKYIILFIGIILLILVLMMF